MSTQIANTGIIFGDATTQNTAMPALPGGAANYLLVTQNGVATWNVANTVIASSVGSDLYLLSIGII